MFLSWDAITSDHEVSVFVTFCLFVSMIKYHDQKQFKEELFWPMVPEEQVSIMTGKTW